MYSPGSAVGRHGWRRISASNTTVLSLRNPAVSETDGLLYSICDSIHFFTWRVRFDLSEQAISPGRAFHDKEKYRRPIKRLTWQHLFFLYFCIVFFIVFPSSFRFSSIFYSIKQIKLVEHASYWVQIAHSCDFCCSRPNFNSAIYRTFRTCFKFF